MSGHLRPRARRWNTSSSRGERGRQSGGNGHCEAGVDGYFDKPAEYLPPLNEEDGPFYGFDLMPGVFATVGGLFVNDCIQVLDADSSAPCSPLSLPGGKILVHIENILLAVNAEFGVNIAQVGARGGRGDAQRLGNA